VIVRETCEEQHLEIVLLLDVGRASGLQIGELSRLHRNINAAAQLAEWAIAQNDRVGLIAYADAVQLRLPALHGLGGLRRLRGVLGELATLPHESNPLPAALTVRQLARQRSLLVWFSDLDDAEAAGQLARAVRLLAPKHLPLLAHLQDDEMLAERDRPAQSWQDPYNAYAAMQSAAAVESAARRLERMGCNVVAARPGQFAGALAARYVELRARKRV
jgi:uncharacterized protein (DUF58 family)